MYKQSFLLLLLIAVLFVLNIFCGSVHIAPSDVVSAIMGDCHDSAITFIIIQHRLPQTVTALLVGAALSTCGLLLQTTFHNPLAGPSVLGISGGASLGVALLMLGGIAGSANPGDGLVVLYLAAFLGALAVTALLLLVSTVVRNNLILLIVGLLLGYLISAVITILYTMSSSEQLQNYVVWGMGDFSSLTLVQVRRMAVAIVMLLILALLLMKSLNALQLGDSQAQNLGINLRTMRNWVLFIVGSLTAVCTTYCGPVSFIGLAVPHVTKLIVRTSDFRSLIPLNMLSGSVVALLCNLLSVIPEGRLLPLNAVTPLIGIPVILYVILRSRKLP